MDWSDVKPWIAKVAPMLGTALGGPLGGAAGVLIGNALGIKDVDPKSIADAIKTGTLDADHILALKKAEEDFQIQMAAMGYKDAEALAELAFKDRDSARQREATIKDKTPMLLAITYTVGFFAILGWMLKHGTPKDGGGEALLILLGALAAGSSQVLAYYFGSSSNSAAKDVMLHQSTPIKN